MAHSPDIPPAAESIQHGYEPATVSVKGLLIFLAIFIVMAVVIHSGIWGLLKVFLAQRRDVDAPQSAVSGQDRFVSPELQPVQAHHQLPWEDLSDLRQKEAAQFQQMGWTIDVATGAAVVPPDVLEELARKYQGAGGGPPVPGQGWPGTRPSESMSSPSAATHPVGGAR